MANVCRPTKICTPLMVDVQQVISSMEFKSVISPNFEIFHIFFIFFIFASLIQILLSL